MSFITFITVLCIWIEINEEFEVTKVLLKFHTCKYIHKLQILHAYLSSLCICASTFVSVNIYKLSIFIYFLSIPFLNIYYLFTLCLSTYKGVRLTNYICVTNIDKLKIIIQATHSCISTEHRNTIVPYTLHTMISIWAILAVFNIIFKTNELKFNQFQSLLWTSTTPFLWTSFFCASFCACDHVVLFSNI